MVAAIVRKKASCGGETLCMLKAPAREKELALLKYVESLRIILLQLVPVGKPGIKEFDFQLPEVYYPDKSPSMIVST